MKLFVAIIRFLTLYEWRKGRYLKMRRERYDELKKLISERHFGGYAGLTVTDAKYDRLDLACFGPPMYQVCRNQEWQYCIFWDRPRMIREIGTGAPLREGEVIIPDTIGRTKPSSTLETIDDKQALTHQKEPSDGTEEV